MFKCGDPDLLTEDEVAALMKLVPEIESWLNRVKDHAMTLAKSNQLPGYKLVAGRSVRQWTNEDEALGELVIAGMNPDDMFTKKFVSVAQAEKLIGTPTFRKVAERLVYRTEGRPVIAPLSDKRAAINAAAEFDAVKTET